MLATQRITSVKDNPKKYGDFIPINVLRWKDEWKALCPYYLKTDGNEENYNKGGILFENFYQGSKIYDIVYENDVYPHYSLTDPKYLWWSFRPVNKDGDKILNDDETINYDLYNRWRDSLWNCPHPVRYPNKNFRRKNTKFTLINSNGKETRLNYLESRKQLYVKEYIRLIKQTKEYKKLLNYLKEGKKLLICEIDVPAKGKNGEFGKDCDKDNNCMISIEKLEILLNDPNEAFGHGLALAYALLNDFQKKFI